MIIHLLDAINKRRFILASGSPRRVEILKSLGLHFEVIPSKFAEDLDKTQFPSAADYAKTNALCKARDVAKRLGAGNYDVILGSDCIVVAEDGTILEKPHNAEHARQMLRALSGHSHHVTTSIALVFGDGREVVASETTKVTFDTVPEAAIDAYVATGSPLDKAGAYGIQDGIASSFITGIEGCYWTVIGLPIHLFCAKLLPFAEEWQKADMEKEKH